MDCDRNQESHILGQEIQSNEDVSTDRQILAKRSKGDLLDSKAGRDSGLNQAELPLNSSTEYYNPRTRKQRLRATDTSKSPFPFRIAT